MTAQARAAVIAGLPKHLRAVAAEVRKLTPGNPEKFVIRKDEIAATLVALAVVIEAEHGGGP